MRRVIFRAVLALAIACCALVPARYAKGETYFGSMRRGNRFYRNELFREALGFFIQGGKKNPGAIEPSFNSGAALYKMEDYVRSVEVLTHALQNARKPEVQADIRYNMGNDYFRLGEFDKAIEQYTEGLALDPYDLDMKYNLELAQKKLELSKQEKEKQGEGGESPGSKQTPGGDSKEADAGSAGTGKKSPAPSQGSAGSGGAKGKDASKPEDIREVGSFSREEAERLVGSVNTDQSDSIGEYLKRRLGSAKNERDW